jgi:hypothetical protein
MDLDRFEKLAEEIKEKTGCKSETAGEEGSPEYKMTFRVEEDPGRKQEINIFPFQEEGEGFIRMITYIGKKQEFSANRLLSFLELNSSLRYGAIALYQGQVAMVATIPFNTATDADKILGPMKYLIKMADSFEKTMVGLDRK